VQQQQQQEQHDEYHDTVYTGSSPDVKEYVLVKVWPVRWRELERSNLLRAW